MQVPQYEREVGLREARSAVDDRSGWQRLDPSGEAVARLSKLSIGRVIERCHARCHTSL